MDIDPPPHKLMHVSHGTPSTCLLSVSCLSVAAVTARLKLSRNMAPCLADTTSGLVMVAAVMLSVALPAVSTATTTSRQHQRPVVTATMAHARNSNNQVLAWGLWDQRQGRNHITRQESGTAEALLDETAASLGSNQQVHDSSWTHAAFRAFHELRAGRPPQSELDADGERKDWIGGNASTGRLTGVRRLASSFPRANGGRGAGSGGESTAAIDSRSDRKRKRDDGGSRERFRQARPAAPACWHVRGRLTNTATGQTIALVEGVELARSLVFETAGERRRRLRSGDGGGSAAAPTAACVAEAGEELEMDRALKAGMWTAFGALASNKFFMYQDPATGEPMEYFRNTPVEKKQVVRTYERFSQVVSHLLQLNGRVLVVSEWGGRSVKAETLNNNGVEEVEGDGGGGGGGNWFGNSNGGQHPRRDPSTSAPRRVFNLHFFVEARTPKEERELKRWQDRPGARWIAFGSPPPRAHGCKEAYSYVTGGGGGARIRSSGAVARDGGEANRPWRKLAWFRRRKGRRDPGEGVDAGGKGIRPLALTSSSSASRGSGGGGGGLMSYTRYGECPTWYGTGRMCGLDVQARRVDSFASLPDKLRQQVLEVDPEFEAGPPSTMAAVRRAAREQRLAREEEERRKGRRSLRRPFGSWGS